MHAQKWHSETFSKPSRPLALFSRFGIDRQAIANACKQSTVWSCNLANRAPSHQHYNYDHQPKYAGGLQVVVTVKPDGTLAVASPARRVDLLLHSKLWLAFSDHEDDQRESICSASLFKRSCVLQSLKDCNASGEFALPFGEKQWRDWTNFVPARCCSLLRLIGIWQVRRRTHVFDSALARSQCEPTSCQTMFPGCVCTLHWNGAQVVGSDSLQSVHVHAHVPSTGP
jgi:hypothetical protein